jgi:UPF0755 protein
MRNAVLTLVVLVAVLAAVGGVAGYRVWGQIHDPYKGYDAAEQFVDIPPGTSSNGIGRRLIDGGVVSSDFVFRAAVWVSGRGRGLKAGEYRFDRPMSAIEVLDVIARGESYARRITFREGLTILEMADLYQMRGFGTAREFVEATRDPAPIRDLDPEAKDLEGYLFPDTYALPRRTPVSQLIAQMVARFRAAYDDNIRAHAEEREMTTREVVTLASLVEKETGAGEERPMVAAVYSNRLKIGMGLQADPTVVYALAKAGKYDGNIRKEDLSLDSPYNTYRYGGLPPGPIASPGKASLEAAAAPADVPYLYFVSRNDGTHAFATTLDEHNANVRKFQVLFFRNQREREQGEGGREKGEAGGRR